MFYQCKQRGPLSWCKSFQCALVIYLMGQSFHAWYCCLFHHYMVHCILGIEWCILWYTWSLRCFFKEIILLLWFLQKLNLNLVACISLTRTLKGLFQSDQVFYFSFIGLLRENGVIIWYFEWVFMQCWFIVS